MTHITSVVLSSPAPEGPGATSAESMVAPELRGIIVDRRRVGHIPYGLDTDRVVGVGSICHEKRGRHSQEEDSFADYTIVTKEKGTTHVLLYSALRSSVLSV